MLSRKRLEEIRELSQGLELDEVGRALDDLLRATARYRDVLLHIHKHGYVNFTDWDMVKDALGLTEEEALEL